MEQAPSCFCSLSCRLDSTREYGNWRELEQCTHYNPLLGGSPNRARSTCHLYCCSVAKSDRPGSFSGADPMVPIHEMVPFLDPGNLVPRIVSPLLSLPSVVPTSTLLIYMPDPPPFFQCKLSGSCSRNGKRSQKRERTARARKKPVPLPIV